jgi:hypothetical protein
MKSLKVTFAIALFALLSTSAIAQQRANVGQLLRGLINVNIGAVQVDVDLNRVEIITVENVLNNVKIDILNNALNRNEVASRNQNFLNNLLRDAEIITGNQVVVGVLSGGQLVIQDLTGL